MADTEATTSDTISFDVKRVEALKEALRETVRKWEAQNGDLKAYELVHALGWLQLEIGGNMNAPTIIAIASSPTEPEPDLPPISPKKSKLLN